MKKLISLLISVVKDLYLYFKPTNKRGIIRFGILAVVITASGFFFVSSKSSSDTEEVAALPIVTVARIDQVSSQSTFSLIGTVAAVSEADLKAETTGRVTAVNVSLGQAVTAGTVIATFENGSEYASVLQAEGAYEAALAAAAQGVVGVSAAENALVSAKNAAIATYNTTYSKLNSTLYNSLDEILADPDNTYRSPGFIPKDFNQKEGLVDTRYSTINKALNVAQSRVVTESSVSLDLQTAVTDTDTLLALITLLQSLIADDDIDEEQTVTETSYLATLSSVRQDILGVRASLDSAVTSITAAQKALEQAQLSGQSGTASAADAQVKQALGVLRAAQANYAKTIVRSPISGVVNELSVKTGDFVSQQARVALVANNDALEVTAYVGERDREQLTVGMSVALEGDVTGIVTAIAPAVDSVTKKFEVKISSESTDLKNGDTVTITVQNSADSIDVDSELLVPITAVKFTNTNGVVFTVEDGLLTEHAVVLGEIRGAYVEIISGITGDQEIVIDARGLTVGREVETVTQ